jgi:hypothetical protein
MIINILKTPTAYINLEHDVEKNNLMTKLLEKFEDVQRIDAVSGSVKLVKFAIASSHTKALNSFESLPFIVLEDDCVSYNFKEEIEIPDDADIVLLGIWDQAILEKLSGMVFLNQGIYEKVAPEVFKANKLCGMHAVMYTSQRGKDIALRSFELSRKTGRHIDNLLREVAPFINVYAIKRPLFAQSSKIKETSVIIKG